MRLPFTREQFFSAFAAYNEALWPFVVILWIASALLAFSLLTPNRRFASRLLGPLLAAQWTWSALAYHVAFFTPINPAAWVFAVLFLVQAVLLWWWSVGRGRLQFRSETSYWSLLAWAFITYAVAYPMINAIQHLSWSRIPTFGVPCPTTIFTIGVLLLATPPSKALAVIPIAWSVVGGSAAGLMGVDADYALPFAGAALAMFSYSESTQPRRPSSLQHFRKGA